MRHGQTHIYGVSLSYLESDGSRWVYYCELPAGNEDEALRTVQDKFHKENPLNAVNPEISVKLLYIDYWSA